MKIFAEMWSGVSDKVTDLVFRVEQFDPEFLSYLGARWQLDRARDDPPLGRRPSWRRRRRRPPVRRSRRSRRRRSPRASSRASGSRSRSATLAKKSAGTTRAPAALVKSSKPAACGRKRRATSSEPARPAARRGAGPARRSISSAVRENVNAANDADDRPGAPRPSVGRAAGGFDAAVGSRHAGCKDSSASIRSVAGRVRSRCDGPGKDSPMPVLLNLIYLDASVRLRALADLPGGPLGEVPGRLVGEGDGRGPAADRRPALRLVPRRERGRGAAAQADPAGAGAAAAGLGPGRLDDDLDRPGGRPADLPRPGDVLRPARFQLGGPAGGRPGPADGAGAGRAGALAEPRLVGEAGRGAGGDRQRPPERAEPPRLPTAPRAARADPPPARRRGRADRGVRRAVRRPGHPPPAGPGDGLGQVRRPGERPEQPPDARPEAGAGALGRRRRVRGRQHDGGRGGRGPGRLPGGAGRAPGPPAGPRAPPRRAVRGGRGLAPPGGRGGRPPEPAGRGGRPGASGDDRR